MNVLGIDCSTDVLCIAVRRQSETGGAAEGLQAGAGAAPAGRMHAKHPYKEPGGHGFPPGVGVVVVELDAGLRHAERLVPAIDFSLAEAGLEKGKIDLVACASGPGSFTGLRIAASTAKGIADALDVPFVFVPTLDCYAREYGGECPIVAPVIDARRGRFYSAIYEKGARITDWLDVTLESLVGFLDSYPEVLFAGPDADYFEPVVADRSGFRIARFHRRAPARALIELAMECFLAHGPSAMEEGPLYVRKSDAEELEAAKATENHGIEIQAGERG